MQPHLHACSKSTEMIISHLIPITLSKHVFIKWKIHALLFERWGKPGGLNDSSINEREASSKQHNRL